MNQPLPPFTCYFSPNIPELLSQLNCTVAISTYQANKFIFLSPKDNEELVQLPRNFEKPMGIAVKDDKLAIASRHEVTILKNAPSLAPEYPEQPKTYDALFMPRATYYTGELDLHDLIWGNEGLWAVNTRFSCLSLIDEDFSFKPAWKPNFISNLAPEDRCHLNGLALLNGNPKYVTALGQTDTQQGWREGKANGGIVMDVETQEIICKGLCMPHSPRIYNNELYFLVSGTGELVKCDVKSGKLEVINKLSGFARGMVKYGDYLFIGLSKIRKKSNTFADLPISKESVFSGIMVIYLPLGSIVGHIKYETSVEEIFDVQILPKMKRPGILTPQKESHKNSIFTPTDSYWAIAKENIA